MEWFQDEKMVSKESWADIDFERSLLRHQRDLSIYRVLTSKERPASGEIRELVSLLKRLFTEERKAAEPIPKKIHQIWLGHNPPEDYKKWMESWKRLPGFTYHLWTDADIATFPLQNRALYEAADNPGAKSDIARYEILYREGGIYTDADTECFHPDKLTALCENLSFFAGIEPLCQALGIWIGNSIIGAQPLSPIMKRVVDALPADYPKQAKSPVYVTGPAYFSHQIKAMLREGGTPAGTVIFPTTVFYPHTKNEVLTAAKEQGVLQTPPETICAHYYGKSWHKMSINTLKRASNPSYPSFEKALQHSKREREAYKFLAHPLHREKEKHAERLTKLQDLYHRLGKAQASSSIPKIIHQIESVSFTPSALSYIASWMGMKGFSYRLWSKEELFAEIPGLRDIPNEKKMDFAKFSLLLRYGGIYAEANLFCYDEVFFDEITNRVGFFAGLEPLAEAKGLVISPLLIGAESGLPLLELALKRMKTEGVTGSKALSEAFFDEKDARYERVVFPPSFFYPFDRVDLEHLARANNTPTIPPECAALRAYYPAYKKRVIL
ncbi:glycosyltransferase [Estrella lausannensis]|uniref:Capsular polysaccharide synthesis protein n=1 Tax=Estrella lausannensis TaxID=483423 RepID=A0A0H5DPD1_9BACT|nr:glycosyltransferase [Estrella lausannensis]CRX38272.1 Capsular polysaccharide synthesis protein [Estrella lausannensis]